MFSKEFKHEFTNFLQTHGISLIYFTLLIMWLLLFSYWKSIRNWDKLDEFNKGTIRLHILGVAIISVLSVIKFLGVIAPD